MFITRSREIRNTVLPLLLAGSLAAGFSGALAAAPPEDASVLDFARLAALRSVGGVVVSPDGSMVAYALSVPRQPGVDEDGGARTELHVMPFETGEGRAFIHGDVSVSAVRFTPDGRHLTYLAKREDDEKTSLWAIPVDGGESRKLLGRDENISQYRISPDGQRVAFVARDAESEDREKAKKKGYEQEVFEEDWRPRKLWIAPLPPFRPAVEDPSAKDEEQPDDADDSKPLDSDEPKPLDVEGSVFELEWFPDGKRLALTVAPRPLIDDRYMSRRVHVVDVESGERLAVLENPGKLGEFAVSPDGRHVAMISAADPNDPSAGRLMIGPAAGGSLKDLLPEFEGHVRHLAWQDDRTLVLVADEGVETWLGKVGLDGTGHRVQLRSGSGSPILTGLSLSSDGRNVAVVGQTPAYPSEVFTVSADRTAARRRTDSNPWLADVELARQETVRWTSRYGDYELEGILIHPLRPVAGSPAPLLLMVHGGPEANDRNGWVTRYSRPGQIAAARGYAVLYPNYRGSTGRGVAFSKLGQGDAAGKEYDDLIDAVDHLVAAGIADKDRVGITGGSYGGYATAWCATKHTDRFRAGVMFVGISNKMSKGLTTEIPVEDKRVHTLFDAWTRLEFSLERSPIYHVEQARTALLIAGGTADSRVDPSQSLQLYRALKLIGKTPVRYVRYPGEGHGNRKAAARDDFARRLMRWMDHFVIEKREDLPPWELELDLGDDENGDESEESE